MLREKTLKAGEKPGSCYSKPRAKVERGICFGWFPVGRQQVLHFLRDGPTGKALFSFALLKTAQRGHSPMSIHA